MQKITKYLCGIVQQAAKITTKSFNIYDKDAFGDIVTDIDKEVESFLIEKLNRKYPDFDIVSEEFNADHNLTTNCFVIDPIDGTKNFAAGIPLWGIQIAAVEDGEVIAAVIYLPKLNELYYADCDGAYLNDVRLEITPERENQHPIVVIEGEKKSPFIEINKDFNCSFRFMGVSSVAFAWVAAGRLTGYYLHNHKVWDYLPGMYLVKMSGGYTQDEASLHVAATNLKMFDTLCAYPNLIEAQNQIKDTNKNTTKNNLEKARAKNSKSATRKTVAKK